MKEVKDKTLTSIQLQTLKIINELSTSKIEVLPADREKFLKPFALLCYEPRSPFGIKGPLFFAKLLFLSVDFRISEDSEECLSVQVIDNELRKFRKQIIGDE